MKYKDSQGNYKGVNTVGETTTEEQVAAVNTAGANQVSAVQAKGQEVLESIPSDYTDLSNDVDNLQSAVDHVDGNILPNGYTVHDNLYINASGGITGSTSAGTSVLALPCEPSTTYKIWKNTVSVMRVACGTALPAAGVGGTMLGKNDPASNDEIIVTTRNNSVYLYLQLYVSGDSADLKTNAVHLGTLTIEKVTDGTVFYGQINDTRKLEINIDLKAGRYKLTADKFTSADTDATTCRIQFNQGDTSYSIYVNRDEAVDVDFVLPRDGIRFTIWASTGAATSSGDAFTVENFKLFRYSDVICEFTNDISALNKKQGYKSLVKNPYPLNFYTVDSESGDTVTRLQEVISTTHAHCRTDADLAILATYYDHVAISNYWPSMPVYPLSAYFTTVPTNFLSSPNAEQVHLAGLSASAHFCSVGSFLSRESEKWDGTVYEMIDEAKGTMQFSNAGGITINHPKSNDALSSVDIIDLLDNSSGIFAMEIYNANLFRNHGAETAYALDIWDEILATGRQIFGVAVPDHYCQYWVSEGLHFGFCHVMVGAKTEQEILSAYSIGRFYSSIYNDTLKFKNINYTTTAGFTVETTESATITFVTANGRSTPVTGTTATYTPVDGDVYVRAEATNGTNTLYTNAVIL
jgi:hypothetical protein